MPRRETNSSPPGFLDSLIVLLVSTGLALFLLWAASRIQGVTAFEQLPDWLRSSYSAVWGLILSGTGLGLAVIKALTRKDQPTFNFLLAILGTTVVLLVAIFLLTYLFKPRILLQDTGANTLPVQKSEPLPPVTKPYEPTLHTEDKDGNQYVITWEMHPTCAGFVQDDSHRCVFTRTQTRFSGNNDPFDHWDMSLKVPGSVYQVICDPTGDHEFNEVQGDHKGSIEGSWARCTGWINGGDHNIRMTVYYRMKW